MSDSDAYVSGVTDRRKRPHDTKRWYRCRCGRWWGVNKSKLCMCNAPPPRCRVTATQQAASDRVQVAILEKLGRHDWAALVRGFIP